MKRLAILKSFLHQAAERIVEAFFEVINLL